MGIISGRAHGDLGANYHHPCGTAITMFWFHLAGGSSTFICLAGVKRTRGTTVRVGAWNRALANTGRASGEGGGGGGGVAVDHKFKHNYTARATATSLHNTQRDSPSYPIRKIAAPAAGCGRSAKVMSSLV